LRLKEAFTSGTYLNWNGRRHMPEAMERELKKEAEKKGLTGKRKNAYIYGTMRKTGWRPSREKKIAGRIG
jgi:hypothetical protein